MYKVQKKIIRVACVCLVFCCFTHPAGARLGESFTECESRYGKATKIHHEGEKHARCYTKGEYRIDVVFWEDKVVEISYRKPEGGILTRPHPKSSSSRVSRFRVPCFRLPVPLAASIEL
jgi:hypothetical protein